MLWFSACHGGSPSPYDRGDHPSCHGHHDGDDVLHDHGVLYVPCGARRDGACHGDHVHDDARGDDRYDDDLLSYGVHRAHHDDDDDVHACDACLPYGHHRRSDGPCGSDPYGTSCGTHRCVLPYRDVSYAHVCRLCGGVHVRDDDHGHHVHPNASCGRHRVRDDDLHDDACHDRHGRLYGGGDVLYVPYALYVHVHDDDLHDAPFHRQTHGENRDPCWQLRRDLFPPRLTPWRTPPQGRANQML